MSRSDQQAFRATIRGRVQAVGFRAATVEAARGARVFGWVRNGDDGTVLVHAEGHPQSLEMLAAFLGDGPPGSKVAAVDVAPAKVEGHEQFAVRGVPAGRFVVQQDVGERVAYLLGLEVDGAMRWWRMPKKPSRNPADKRMAFQLPPDEAPADVPGVTIWDEGAYEQGGRVAWPEAIDRGHAVFVLHGHTLQGGFALQRTRKDGAHPQWLVIKRRDADAKG
ncbi:MAG: acylphosphatase [Solirubrobacteraceae bacterium]|nr:acylphosphatase [Solirubrobacteraceae bacterium]